MVDRTKSIVAKNEVTINFFTCSQTNVLRIDVCDVFIIFCSAKKTSLNEKAKINSLLFMSLFISLLFNFSVASEVIFATLPPPPPMSPPFFCISARKSEIVFRISERGKN